MKASVRIRLGRRRVSPLGVPGEIFDVYQPVMGVQATLLWLNMRWLEHAQTEEDIEQALQVRLGVPFAELSESLEKLMRFELLEIGSEGEYVLHEPLSAEGFALRFGTSPQDEGAIAEVAVTSMQAEPSVVSSPEVQLKEQASEPEPSEAHEEPAAKEEPVKVKAWRSGEENLSADMEAVMDLYHRKIGMAGPTQFEKLRFWVEEQGMEGEVVAAAIEETVQSAQVPRINYLEGILRNWCNDNIRTLKDLVERKASKVLSGSGGKGAGQESMEGVPNAEAYRRVDPKMVKKWKELYPDEYGS